MTSEKARAELESLPDLLKEQEQYKPVEIVSTTNEIPNCWIKEHKGIVHGSGNNFEEAYKNMALDAAKLGANAVIGMRCGTATFGGQYAIGYSFFCYGTAVSIETYKAEPEDKAKQIDLRTVFE